MLFMVRWVLDVMLFNGVFWWFVFVWVWVDEFILGFLFGVVCVVFWLVDVLGVVVCFGEIVVWFF